METCTLENRAINHIRTFILMNGGENIKIIPRNETPDFLSWTFEKNLESGKDYLYGGDYPMSEFLKKKSPISPLQKGIFEFLKEYPNFKIYFTSSRKGWTYSFHLYYDGSMRISLPYHGEGGEKDWVTKDGKYKYLVNVD